MREFMKKHIRACGTISDILPLSVIISFFLVLSGQLVGASITSEALLGGVVGNILGEGGLTDFLLLYLSTIGVWIVYLPVIWFFKKNRPMMKGLLHNEKGNNMKGFGIGLLLGFLFNSACVLMSVLMGDIKLSFYGIDPVLLIVFFIAVLIQSGSEELSDRLHLFQKLRRRYRSPLVAIIGNSLMFCFLHIFNPGFTAVAGTQILLIGLIWSLFVYYYDSLWAAIAFHTAWNFTQNLIYGLPNSGIVSEYSIFTLEAASARNGLFYNVNFGVEGSVGACALLAGLLIYMIVKNKNKPEATDLWAEMEAEAEAAAAAKEAAQQ